MKLSFRRHLANDHGSGLTFVLVGLAVFSVVGVGLFSYAEMRRAQLMRDQLRATRAGLVLDIEHALQSTSVVFDSLMAANLSPQNPKLDACIKAANPNECEADIGFHLLSTGLGLRLAGPSDNQAYFNASGEPCDPKTESCHLSAKLSLIPRCPPGLPPTACPDAKVFEFRYDVRTLNLLQIILRPADNQGTQFAVYAIDANPFGYGVSLVH